MKIKIVTAALMSAMVLSLSGCGKDKGEIEKLMTEFEYSCNELDIDTMLDCIDPAVSDKIRLATGIASMITDKNSDELTGELVGMLTGDGSLNADEFFSSISIEPKDIKTGKKSAAANAIVEYSVGGEKFKKDTEFEFVNTMDKWYIASFKLK